MPWDGCENRCEGCDQRTAECPEGSDVTQAELGELLDSGAIGPLPTGLDLARLELVEQWAAVEAEPLAEEGDLC